MNKFNLLASFFEPGELAQWQIDKKLSWGTTRSDLRKFTTCQGASHILTELPKGLRI